LSSRFAENRNQHPYKPEDGRNDTIRDISTPVHIPSELEAQPTVDYPQCYQDATEPDVSVRSRATLPMLFEAQVVDDAEDGLEE
jgi:hypothetical protein